MATAVPVVAQIGTPRSALSSFAEATGAVADLAQVDTIRQAVYTLLVCDMAGDVPEIDTVTGDSIRRAL